MGDLWVACGPSHHWRQFLRFCKTAFSLNSFVTERSKTVITAEASGAIGETLPELTVYASVTDPHRKLLRVLAGITKVWAQLREQKRGSIRDLRANGARPCMSQSLGLELRRSRDRIKQRVMTERLCLHLHSNMSQARHPINVKVFTRLMPRARRLLHIRRIDPH